MPEEKMKKATIFLVLTFLLSWTVYFCVLSSRVKPYSAPWLAMAAYFMFTPMISAIIAQKLIFHESVMGPLCISFRINRWYLVALLLPAFLAIASTLVSSLFVNVSFSLDPTDTNIWEFFGKNLPDERVAELNRSVTELPLHPFILVLIGGTIAGLTINGIAGFGEELGWRGLLLRESAQLGFWKSSCAIGFIWGLWHLPFIIHGYNYPGHPIAGVFMMIVWTVLFSPLIAYVCIRSNSVISAAMMHGAINGTAMAPAIVLKGGDSLQVGVMGVAGILVLIFLNLVLLGCGKPREWHNKWMERTLDRAAHP